MKVLLMLNVEIREIFIQENNFLIAMQEKVFKLKKEKMLALVQDDDVDASVLAAQAAAHLDDKKAALKEAFPHTSIVLTLLG